MLGQREIGKYLDEWSGNLTAIEEILSAYIVWKYLKGASSSRVLVKIKYLAMYLRFSGRAHILREAADIFKVLTIEVSIGGGRIGLLPSRTTPGKEIWNRIRREAPARLRRRGLTGATYGGPVPVQEFLTQAQREPWQPNQERTPWAEQFFFSRQRFGEAPVIHENTTAGHRETTLPFYETRRRVLEAVALRSCRWRRRWMRCARRKARVQARRVW